VGLHETGPSPRPPDRPEDAFVERKSQGIGAKTSARLVCLRQFPSRGPSRRCLHRRWDKGEIHGVDVPDALQKRVRAACGGCYRPCAANHGLTVEARKSSLCSLGPVPTAPLTGRPMCGRVRRACRRQKPVRRNGRCPSQHRGAVLRLLASHHGVRDRHQMGQLVHVQGDYRESAECK